MADAYEVKPGQGSVWVNDRKQRIGMLIGEVKFYYPMVVNITSTYGIMKKTGRFGGELRLVILWRTPIPGHRYQYKIRTKLVNLWTTSENLRTIYPFNG